MEHVVFYQSAQGTPAFRRVASLEDAVSFAEHLRNVEGITDFSVYSLAPVTLSMRAYYHVEVSGADTTDAAPAGLPAQAAPTAAPEPAFMATTLPPDAAASAAPVASPGDADSPPSALSFTALEEASTPLEQMPPPANVPFAAAPLPPPTDSASQEAFGNDAPAPLPPAAATAENAAEQTPVDPNVVDPTTEEVVPVPPGRRSMGFFARS